MITIHLTHPSERTTDPMESPKNQELARKIIAHWQAIVEAKKTPVATPDEKPVRSKEQIREEMDSFGRAIEDHPNLYAAFTIAGVFAAMYGLASNIVGTTETNLALARIVTNLTQYF